MSQKPTAPETSGYQAPTVRKAFAMVRAVYDAQTPAGHRELAQSLGFDKGTPHGLWRRRCWRRAPLNTISREKMRLLGPAPADLSLKRWNYFRMAVNVRPLLNDLLDRIDGTVSPDNRSALPMVIWRGAFQSVRMR